MAPTVGVLAGADEDPFKLALKFSSEGSTGSRELDRSVGAAALNQYKIAEGATPQELFDDIMKEKIPELQRERAEQMKAAMSGSGLTGSQALAAAILQIAPIIIGGMISGKRGAGVGAGAGAMGGITLVQGAQKANEEKKLAGLASVKATDENIKELGKQAQDTQKFIFQQQENVLDRQNRIEAGAASRSEFKFPDPATTRQVAATRTVKAALDDTVQFIQENFKKELEEGETTLDVIGRKLQGIATLKKNDPDYERIRKLNSKIKRSINLGKEAQNTGAPSNLDLQYVEEAFTSGALPTMDVLLSSLIDARDFENISERAVVDTTEQGGRNVSGFRSGGPPTEQPPISAPLSAPVSEIRKPVIMMQGGKSITLNLTRQEMEALKAEGAQLKTPDGRML